MRYRWNTYLQPGTVEEVLKLLDKYGSDARLIAGGTDLIVGLEKEECVIPVLIDVCRIKGLDLIKLDDGRLSIGAGATLDGIEKSELVRDKAPLLVEAVHMIGSPQIRNTATLAGNVGNASPAADGTLALLALDGSVRVAGRSGERDVTLSDFMLGPGRTQCGPGEMITSISLPVDEVKTNSHFQKIGLRKAMNIAVANVAIALSIEEGKVRRSRIALGAVGPTAIRALAAEEALKGKRLDDGVINEVSELCMEQSSPIDDIRASAEYRKKLIRALSKRCMENVLCQVK